MLAQRTGGEEEDILEKGEVPLEETIDLEQQVSGNQCLQGKG